MRHIAFLGVQLYGNDAGMLRGVFRFARQRPDWVLHDPSGPRLRDDDPAFRPDGIIANLINAPIAAYCKSFRVPVVNISAPLPGIDGFPTVSTDAEAVGRIVARHFLERGIRSFAWFNHLAEYPFITDRVRAFEREVREHGLPCESFTGPAPSAAWGGEGLKGGAERPLAEWLRGLPRPCGLFATSDLGGRGVCRVCLRSGLNVPEDIAVVGVDDFEFICETSHPPLSSVRLANEEIGFRAAELLDRMFRRETVPALSLFQPGGIHVRQSSDTIAVQDRAVANALAFIRRNASTSIAVPDVASASGTNRRALERRFRDILGRTVLQEIHHARIELAKKLLVETNMPIAEIARSAGFRDYQQIDIIFRRNVGISPVAFRRTARSPDEQSQR